jgi:hypothetical protein
MKRILLAACSAIALATSASAQDWRGLGLQPDPNFTPQALEQQHMELQQRAQQAELLAQQQVLQGQLMMQQQQQLQQQMNDAAAQQQLQQQQIYNQFLQIRAGGCWYNRSQPYC